MVEKVFLNDGLVEADRACISVRDAGFLYGAGLFETMRSYGGVVFALNDHLDRLLFSAQSLDIKNPYSRKQMADAVYQTLEANELTDARVRLTLSAGPMTAGQEGGRATLLVTAAKLSGYPAEYYKRGVLVILSAFKQNRVDPTFGHKTTCYFPRMLALKAAHQKRAAEALWFTVDNRLAEGCISNVFLVKDSKLLTPPVETPVLAGVARKTVCQIAVNEGIELVEKNLFINDLLEADEVFLTNVIMQVLPVIRVEAHTVGDGKVGAVTRRLFGCFGDFVQAWCAKEKPSV